MREYEEKQNKLQKEIWDLKVTNYCLSQRLSRATSTSTTHGEEEEEAQSQETLLVRTRTTTMTRDSSRMFHSCLFTCYGSRFWHVRLRSTGCATRWK